MFDGIAIQYVIKDFSKWKNAIQSTAPDVMFCVPVNEETGLMNGREYNNHTTYTHSANFETYSLKVLETHKPAGTTYFLKINGSLHKNYFKGENYSRFTFNHLNEEINSLCAALQLIPNECFIKVLEAGVNIPFQSSPINYIQQSVLLHKTTEFKEYNERDGICLGRYAKHTQYSVKIYDKGLQHQLPNSLLRVELRFVKMQPLKNLGIITLEDLTNIDKVAGMINLLSRAWMEVLIYEPDINIETLEITIGERELLITEQYRDHWQ